VLPISTSGSLCLICFSFEKIKIYFLIFMFLQFQDAKKIEKSKFHTISSNQQVSVLKKV